MNYCMSLQNRMSQPFALFVKGWGIALSATALFCLTASMSGLHAQTSCALHGIKSSSTLDYPPIAVAAHVEGAVTLRAAFDPNGTVANVKAIEGPVMLYDTAIHYVSSWVVNEGSSHRECAITITFQLRPDPMCDSKAASSLPDTKSWVSMSDLQHFTVTSGPAGYCEDLSIPVRKHSFLFFHWNTKVKMTDLAKLSKV